MKVYLVEKSGGEYDSEYSIVVEIYATLDRAIQCASELSLEKRKSAFIPVHECEKTELQYLGTHCIYAVFWEDSCYNQITLCVTEVEVQE